MEKILFFCSGQQAFWKQFDAWQTDSCTVGDDFFMHMIGSWWKNPVDVYPNGLLGYAGILNNQRVNEIKQTNANLQHLKKHLEDNLAISTEEIEQMVQAKVDELWAGATTGEEALAALGRAWAQGYFNKLEPIVNIVDGVPTWQVTGKLPTFISADQISKNIADLGGCCLALQILLGEHPNATAAEKKSLTQRFFQAWAIQWGTTYNLDYLKAVKESDVHSQSRERTNGVVRNIDEWYDAFDITSGTLYLSPDKRVTIW